MRDVNTLHTFLYEILEGRNTSHTIPSRDSGKNATLQFSMSFWKACYMNTWLFTTTREASPRDSWNTILHEPFLYELLEGSQHKIPFGYLHIFIIKDKISWITWNRRLTKYNLPSVGLFNKFFLLGYNFFYEVREI